MLKLWDDRSFFFYESLLLTHRAAKRKLALCFFEAQQYIFPSKLVLVAVSSEAGVPKRWKYLALLCTRNTRSKRCFSPVAALIIFVKPELHLDNVRFWGMEFTGDELSVADGEKKGPQKMNSEGWMALHPPHSLLVEKGTWGAHFPWPKSAFLSTPSAATVLTGVLNSFCQDFIVWLGVLC